MKKLLATLLALVMLLVPVLSMAESAMTLDISLSNVNLTPFLEEEADPSQVEIINDLINALGLTVYSMENEDGSMQLGLSLNLSGQSALTLDAQVAEDAILLGSNLLGSDVIAVTPDELIETLKNNKDALLELGLSEEDYDALMEQLPALFSDPMSGLDASAMDLSDLDLTATMEAVQAFAETMQVAEGELTEQPADCDPATSVAIITMDGNAMLKVLSTAMSDIMNTAFFQNYTTLMNGMLQAQGEDEVDFAAVVQEMFNKLSIKDDVVVTVYADEYGDAVRVEYALTLIADGNEDDALEIDGVLTRLTGDTLTYTLTNKLTVDGETADVVCHFILKSDTSFTVDFTASADDEVVYASLDAEMAENGGDLMFIVTVTDEDGNQEGMRVHEVISEEENTTMVIDYLPLEDDTPWMTITITVSETAEQAKLDGSNAVRVLSMSEEELNAWIEGLQSNMQIALIGALQLLPESVLNMIMGN